MGLFTQQFFVINHVLHTVFLCILPGSMNRLNIYDVLVLISDTV